MAMEITNNYNNVYESSSSDYISKLQKKVPTMKLRVGDGLLTSKDRIVGSLTINPDILSQMKSDPKKEEYYTQRMRDIERAEKLTQGITSARGFTTVYSHWYIDKDGKIWNTAQTIRKDKLNEKLRKEAQENAEKQIEKIRENAHIKAEELAVQLEEKTEKLILEKLENSRDGKIYFDDAEIQTILEAVKKKGHRKMKSDISSQTANGVIYSRGDGFSSKLYTANGTLKGIR